MSSCPRCVRAVPPGATHCPNCGYDLRPADWSAPFAAPPQAPHDAAPGPAQLAPPPPHAPSPPHVPPAPPGGYAPGGPGAYGPNAYAPAAYAPAGYGSDGYGPDGYDSDAFIPQPGPLPRRPRADDSGLIPGFAEDRFVEDRFVDDPARGFDPSRPGGPPRRPRSWVGVGAVAGALVIVVLIIVIAATRMGHRGGGQSSPVAAGTSTSAGVATPTSVGPSANATSASVPASASSTPTTAGPGPAQAATIANYLNVSSQARKGINAAIGSISGCSHIASAVSTLQSAAQARANIVTELASADVSALPHGTTAVADLRQAMRASANADQHYAAWGQAVAATCHKKAPHNANFSTAQRYDSIATAAKQRFADEWNPIAVKYGLAKQSADTI